MNKTVCLKSSLMFALAVTLLLVTLASGKILPNLAPTSAIEGSRALVEATRTLLPDGRLLVAGGQDRTGRVTATLATRDPLTGTVTILDATMRFPRSAHTATVLPDGTVLILGGTGQTGNLVSSAELFDPMSGAVRLLADAAPTPRAFHTATLLTDGRVLVAGGVFAGGVSATTIELWDYRGKHSTTLRPQVVLNRQNHIATLLADGTVILSGGKDGNGKPLTNSQIFDPQSQTVAAVASPESVLESSGSLTEMRASSPQDGDQNVPLDALIAVRFSRPVQMASVNAAAAILQGPDGIVNAKVVAAEGGMLAFITPTSSFLSGTAYTVKLSGIVDAATQSVAYAEITFSTSGAAPASASFGEEEWSPTSDWRTHRVPSKYESLPDLEGPRGSTALAGQVLKLNGEPLQHVTLEIGNRRTESDGTGRFLITNIPAGHQVLVIEGATANTPGKKYGRFEFGDEIKDGKTNKLDFKIWMSLLDIAHEITIPSPTAREMILTTPIMPGLELRLPAGTVITDASGKVVTKITITPIPVDRPPFPLPFVQIPIYFTIQPGGSYISVSGNGPKGARLFYPNNEHKPAGMPYAFWNYNADHNGWFVYGAGRVNKERTEVVPDPGVLIYDFSGAMVGSGTQPTTGGNGGSSSGGEPVDLSSGLYVYNKADLVLSDVIPLSLTRTYRPYDSLSRPFGVGASHDYEIFLGGDGNAFGATPYIDLILASGSRIHFTGVPVYGQGYPTYLSSSSATPWYGAIISRSPVNPNGYILPGWAQLQTKDGTIYSFPEASGLINPGCQALVGITDRYGNQVKITRNTDANCTIAQITSPSGRYIQFTYDTSYRVKIATDNLGRQVFYNYDASGRLYTVTDANNGLWTYGYDSLNRMTTIEDPRLITYLTNTYDSSGNLYRQYLADGTSFYQFAWVLTSNTTNNNFVVNNGGGPAPYQVLGFRNCTTCNEGFPSLASQVSVTDPRGYTRVVKFNQNGYATSDTQAYGQPEQETTTYSYYADNLLNTATDQLGRVTAYVYDLNDNPMSVTWLSGTSNAITTSATSDSVFSLPLSATDPLGNTTSLNYDTYGNALNVTDPLNHQITFGYNGIGLVTSVTDATQNQTQFAYDFADLIGITDPLLNTTSMFHDAVGRVSQRTDPLGHTTKYQYNNLNEVTQITDPLQGITSFSYDGDGNLQNVHDPRQQGTNNKTVYTYDNFNHLQTRTDPLLRQESYVFDQLGNLTSFTDRRGKLTTYRYDGINRRTFAGFGTAPTYESTINYNYDGGDRFTSVVDSSSGTITPVFDGLDRLTSETTPQGSVTYTYDSDSNLTKVQVAGQTAVNYYYDNASRLYKVTHGTSTLIGYDSADRRSSLTLPNGVVLTYGYDNDSRINSMSYQLGTTAVGSLSYMYDAAGRRTQVGGSLAATGFPNAVSSAAYDVANELTGWNGTTIGYDANGNVQNDGVASYTWNGRNQLISRGATSFQYDSFGRRTLNAAGNNLLYEGWNVAQELSGTTPVANQILGGIDEFFSRTVSGGTYSPITDGLGSVLALTNSSGAIKTQYGYDSFGNTTTSGSANTNVFQYTGRENDGNGLYYYRARYYNPSQQRFISEDPIGFDGGIDFYEYVDSSPLGSVDPFGLSRLVFNRGSGTMDVYDGNGNLVGTYAAGNSTTNPNGDPNVVNSHGPAPNGTYPVQPPINTGNSPELLPKYGPYFFPVGAPGSLIRQRGIGIHGGRIGPNSRTWGCIRVSNDTDRRLYQLYQTDPIRQIKIQ